MVTVQSLWHISATHHALAVYARLAALRESSRQKRSGCGYTKYHVCVLLLCDVASGVPQWLGGKRKKNCPVGCCEFELDPSRKTPAKVPKDKASRCMSGMYIVGLALSLSLPATHTHARRGSS